MLTNNLIVVIPLASFLFYCALFVILMGSNRNKISKYYTFYITAMIVWSFGSFMMRTGLAPGPLFYNRIACVGLITMPIVFYHFTLIFSRGEPDRTLYAGYIMAGIFNIGSLFGAIISEAHLENNEFHYKLGPLASVMALWSLLYLILALVNILGKVKSGIMPYKRVRYVIAGIILVIAGGLLNLLPSLGKYPFDIISNTINAIFIAYSIYRYKFLEIRLIFRKGLAYSVYTLIFTGLYIVTIFIAEKILSELFSLTGNIKTLLVAVMLAFVFQPFKNMIQNCIDRLFYREKLDHQVFLRDFSAIINNVLDLDELADILVKSVKKALRPEMVCLVLKNNKEDYELFRSSEIMPCHDNITFSAEHPIIQSFLNGKQLFLISEIENSPAYSSLWDTEKEQLNKLKVELAMPVRSRDKLIGFITVSEKKGGEAYSQNEIDLLFTMINGSAVVIENARMYEDLKRQAITDGLTKLYNHRYFHEILRSYITKPGTVFSVAIMDVDFFKVYNDIYGHSAGDKALAKIADVLRASVRSEDVTARYGGEEFTVLFPGIEGEEALMLTENIRKAVQNSFIYENDTSEFITISAGVACFPKHGSSGEEILKLADYAMYEAKRGGKNQSVLYSTERYAKARVSDSIDTQDSIKSAYISSIYALAATIDARDHYTYGHSANVSKYAVALAKASGLDKEKVEIVRISGLLHDIGKIGVPENILTKPDRLTAEELEIMRKHVEISISIIKHIPTLTKVIPAILNHHERYDGLGYPRGIKGENIPIEGRCLCIADSYDAMTSSRPYTKALKPEEAVEEIIRCSGTQFDPKLAQIFAKIIREENNIPE